MGSQGWGWGGGCGRGGGAAGGPGWFPEGWRWWEPPGPWLKSLLSLRGRPGLGLEWPAAGGLDQGLGVLGWRVVMSRLPLGSSSGRAARKQLFLPCSCSHPGWSPDPAAAGRPGFAPWESEVGGPGLKLASSAPSSLCPSPEDRGGRGVGVGAPSTAPAAVARCARVWSKRLTHGGAASGLHGEALSPRGLPCGG